MPPIDDQFVPHEAQVDKAILAELARVSQVPALPNIGNSAAAPTQAEHNALVASHNQVLQVLRDAKLIPAA